MTELTSTHNVILGFLDKSGFSKEKAAGVAYRSQEFDGFICQFWQWGERPFYVCLNKSAEDRFTIYTKMKQEGENIMFQQPVGRGWYPKESKAYLQLYFHLSKATAFIDLYPKN